MFSVYSMGKGKLVFKGSEGPSKRKVHSKHELEVKSGPILQETKISDEKIRNSASARLPQSTQSHVSSKPETPTLQKGEGMIISSGNVITGFGTKFFSCLNAGDAIVVEIQNKQEMRVVTMRLSDTSAAISTAFSNDLKMPTCFNYIQKPRDFRAEEMATKKKEAASKQEVERHAFGTYGAGTELVYRERTEHGSYRIKKEGLPSQNLNRSELLEKRAKKTSDKYC